MDETIDLRPYVAAVVRYLWLILGAIILAVILSILLFLSQDDYDASALVTVPEPTQQLQFDPRIVSNVRSPQLLTAYPQLAVSDDVLTQLLPIAQELMPDSFQTLSQLRDALDVVVTPDGRIVRLTATMPDAQSAAAFANAWADEFINAVETVYGRGGLSFYIEQRDQASQELAQAEAALVAFQTTNRQTIVDNELASLTALQTTYLNQQNAFQVALNDLDMLRVQLENNASDVVVLAEQLTALSLQLQPYQSAQGMGQLSGAPSFQLNIGADSQLTTPQRSEELQRLEALRLSIDAAMTSREAQLATLEPMIFALQTEKQQLFNEGERLINRRAIAVETYTTLVRKVDEERVATKETVARLASRAAVPERPARSNLFILLPLAVVVTLLLSAAVIIALTWWRQVRA